MQLHWEVEDWIENHSAFFRNLFNTNNWNKIKCCSDMFASRIAEEQKCVQVLHVAAFHWPQVLTSAKKKSLPKSISDQMRISFLIIQNLFNWNWNWPSGARCWYRNISVKNLIRLHLLLSRCSRGAKWTSLSGLVYSRNIFNVNNLMRCKKMMRMERKVYKRRDELISFLIDIELIRRT